MTSQTRRNFLRVTAAGASAAAVLTTTRHASAKEKMLVIGDYFPATTLDPAASTSGLLHMLTRNIFQGLLRFKHNSVDLEGDLARSWAVSKDGLVHTFKLRNNIQWHKGFGQVTAQDVKFSFDRVMDPQTRSPFGGEIREELKDIKIVDDFTVEIHVKIRSAAFLYKTVRPVPVAIVCRKAVEKFGKDFARNPVGSGPYVFESMDRDQVVLVGNKDYYEGPPKIERVIYKSIPDDETRYMALGKGDIDVILYGSQEKAVVDRIRAQGIVVKTLNPYNFELLLLNPQFKPFSDVRVRRALAHAINKDAIANHVFSGLAERFDSCVPKGYFGHTEEGIRRYEFNPQKARELLAEAGYAKGFDVVADTSNSPRYLPVAVAIQDQLKKVGVNMNLNVMQHATFSKGLASGETKMCVLTGTYAPDADIPLTKYFHGAGFPPGQNLMRYDKLDKEIEAARRETDPRARLKMYHEIQKKLAEDVPAIPLVMLYVPTPRRPNVTGLPDRDPMQGFSFYHLDVAGK